jgi:ribosome-binding factor A
LRVGEEVRHILANVLERGVVRDPDVAGKVITVTEVAVSPDLRNASVYVVEMGGGDIQALLAGLKRVSSFFRHELAKRMNLRTVPMLHFHADTSFDRASRIDALLATPEVRRDLEGDSSESESDE